MIGKTIGHYRVTEKLGQGGMGEVYLAEDTSLRRKVALKFLPENLKHDRIARRRFIREARSAAAIDHPYICKIYEVGEVEQRHFIAMEYVEGQTLKKKMAGKTVALKDSVRIALQTAGALEKAHRAGIVHRDLKPDNIMITPEGHAKVMDFGLAKQVVRGNEDITAGVTLEGSILGTLNYMSPEQVQGIPLDARSDIFSLGVILYELLSGIHPFRAENEIATVGAILHKTPPPLAQYSPEPAEILHHTVDKMLAKNPEKRYQSIREVENNLKRVTERLSVAEVQAPGHRFKLVNLTKRVLAVTTTILILLIGAAAVLWTTSERFGDARDAEEPTSLAVLPLTNLSRDPEESDYVAAGISRAVITRLVQAGLRVTPWQTVRQFSGSTEPPEQIARRLNVDNVLVGTFELVQDARGGERILTTLSLMESKSGLLSWADEFEEPFEDIFRVQRQIATGAATSLRTELTGEQRELLARPESRSVEAWDNYLTGAHILQQEGKEATDIAFEYFSRAVELDPNLSEAHLGLGGVYGDRYWWGWGGLESLDLMRASYERALELDPSSLRARRGLIALAYMRGSSEDALTQWREASRYARPDDVETLLTRGKAYHWSLFSESAAALYRRALELDPLNGEAHFFLLMALWSTEPGQAIEFGQTILERFGDMFNEIDYRLALAHQLLGNYEKAREHYETAMVGSPFTNPQTLLHGGILFEDLGDREGAEDAWRKGLELVQPDLSIHPDNVRLRLFKACFLGLLGEHAEFLKEEKRALAYDLNDQAIVHLAEVHARLGDVDRAVEILGYTIRKGRIPGDHWDYMITSLLAPVTRSTDFETLVKVHEAEVERLRELY